MARALSTPTSISYGAVNQGANTQVLTYSFYISSNDLQDDEEYAYRGWGYSAAPSASTLVGSKFGNPPGTKWINSLSTGAADCDDLIYFRHYGEFWWESRDLNWTIGKNFGPYRTWASDPTLGDAPTLDNPLAFSIRVNNGTVDEYIPSTKDTATNLYIEYKKTSDPTWVTYSLVSASKTGYSSITCGTDTVAGLDPDTSYDFRYALNRTGTSNSTVIYYSATSSLSTLPDVPEVTTNTPTGIGLSEAVFSATVDHNLADGNLYCRWSPTDPVTPDNVSGTKVSYSGDVPMITADGTYQGFGSGGGPVTGLIDVDEDLAETFYVWAVYEYGGGSYDDDVVFGSIVEFATLAEPGAGGDGVDYMIPLQFDGQFGVAKTVYFTLRAPAAVNNDTFYASTAPLQVDVKIYHDGAEQGSSSDNSPARIGSSKVYSLVLSAVEMSPATDKELVNVIISDAAGSAFRDVHIEVRLQQKMSRVELNTDQMSGAQSAFYAKGIGAGHGIEAIAGPTGRDIKGVLGDHVLARGSVTSYAAPAVTLTDGFDATDDYYNGDIIYFYSGTGAGQSRVINDFTSGGVATLSSNLTTALDGTEKYVILPGARALDGSQAEITSVPTDASTMAEKIQFLVQRFQQRIIQTATAQTWYESDGSTVFGVRSAADDGSTQDLGQLTNP